MLDLSVIPISMKYGDLKQTHCEYKPSKVVIANDFYYGGDSFEQNKSKYLRYRGVEEGGSAGGANMRRKRLEAALYEPVLPGVVDFICSSVCQVPAVITAEGDAKRVEYYQGLNKDTGNGANLASLCFELLLNAILHKRAYIAVRFTPPDVAPQSQADQAEARGLDASFSCLQANDVDMWEFGDDGQLEWARTHTVSNGKSINSPFLPYDRVVHRFTYFTKTASYPYELVLNVRNGKPEALTPASVANLIEAEVVEYPKINRVPIIPVKLPVHIIDRLISLAKATFNRSASLEFNLDEQAFSQMWIKGVVDIKSVDVGESTIVNLGDSQYAQMGYAEISAVPAANLSLDVTRLTNALFASVNSAALKLPSSDQNISRMSGNAHDKIFGKLSVVLQAFAAALKDSIEFALDIPIVARGDEDLNVRVDGLDEFSDFDPDELLARVKAFVGLPGVSTTATDYVLKQTALDMVGDAPQDIKNKIKAEKANEISSANPPEFSKESNPKKENDAVAKKEETAQEPI